jgi:hypothetical protein
MAPFNTVPPTIDGTAEVGGVLVADAGAWSGSGPIAFAYTWRCDGQVVGVGASFIPALPDEGFPVTVTVDATDVDGTTPATASTDTIAPARPTYATGEALRRYLAVGPDALATQVPTDDDDMRRLLRRAERDVDNVLGRAVLLPNGRKLAPVTLTGAQRDALARATCAAAEQRLVAGEDALVGDDEFIPNGMATLRQLVRPAPKIFEELVGSGLLRWSGIAAPDDDDA